MSGCECVSCLPQHLQYYYALCYTILVSGAFYSSLVSCCCIPWGGGGGGGGYWVLACGMLHVDINMCCFGVQWRI